MINQILQEKKIVLNKKNNNKQVLNNLVKRGYTHIFISFKIVFLKQLKNSVLDQIFCIDFFALLAINKIHLFEK